MKRQIIIALIIGISVGIIVSVSSARLSYEALNEVRAALAAQQQAEQLRISINERRSGRSEIGDIPEEAVKRGGSQVALSDGANAANQALLQDMELAREELGELSNSYLESAIYLLQIMFTIRPTMVFIVIASTVSILILKFYQQKQHANRLEESEKVLRSQKNELETIVQQRERFIATLAHDMKVPLVGADLVFSLMMDEKVKLERKERVGLLQKLRENNADVLSKLQDMIQIYRYENPELFRHVSAVNMAELLQRCVERVIPFAQLQGVTIKPRLSNADLTCAIDVPGVERLIVSLLDNAVKVSARDSIVSISTTTQNHYLSINISDKGKGISREDQSRLFDSVSSRGSAGSRYAGNGLGLYLAKLVVEAHKGSIDCVSELGEGSTFTVRLPLA
jgi:signal transduction histidine kinase